MEPLVCNWKKVKPVEDSNIGRRRPFPIPSPAFEKFKSKRRPLEDSSASRNKRQNTALVAVPENWRDEKIKSLDGVSSPFTSQKVFKIAEQPIIHHDHNTVFSSHLEYTIGA